MKILQFLHCIFSSKIISKQSFSGMKAVVASLLVLLAASNTHAACDGPSVEEFSCPIGAPGDHDSSCRTGFVNGPKHIFPDEWRVLLDNYDYTFLFSPDFFKVWEDKSFDGNSLSVCKTNDNPLYIFLCELAVC